MKFSKLGKTLLGAALVAVLGISGCSNDSKNDIDNGGIVDDDVSHNQGNSDENREASININNASYDIFSQAVDLYGTEKNLVISPISIQRALEVISRMTSDREGLDLFKLYDTGSILDHKYNNSVMDTVLLLNSNSYDSKSTKKIVDNIKIVDFPKQAEKEVENLQKEVLKEVIYKPEFKEENNLVIADAIRYYSKWQDTFPEENTSKKPFVTHSNEEVSVDMMYQKLGGIAVINDNYEAFSLNADESARVYFIKPKGDINYVKENLGDIISEYNETYDEYDVNFYLPKTSVENELDIKELIANIGLERLFKPGITPDKLSDDLVPLFISDAKQVAKMDVDEEGAEAKAVTVIMMDKTSAPMDPKEIDIKMDSPYFIVVTDREENSGQDYVVFTSLIVNPLEN